MWFRAMIFREAHIFTQIFHLILVIFKVFYQMDQNYPCEYVGFVLKIILKFTKNKIYGGFGP